MTIRGKVRSASTGLTIAFASPKTAAPSSSGPQRRISTPSNTQSTTTRMTTFTPHAIRTPTRKRWPISAEYVPDQPADADASSEFADSRFPSSARTTK
jgi:hypothetical protein